MASPVIPDISDIRRVPIGEVTPSPENPRTIPARAVEIVKKSLAEFGWQQPLVIDDAGVLLVGHTRLLAAKALKATHVPVVVAHGLSEDQKRAYRIADNRTGEYASWDYTALTNQLDDRSEEFGDVLGLADWQSIIASLDDIPEMDLADDVVDRMTDEKNALTVTFTDDASKIAAERVILDIPGVVDVRHKR